MSLTILSSQLYTALIWHFSLLHSYLPVPTGFCGIFSYFCHCHCFSNISLTECQEALSERQFVKQTCDTNVQICLELTFANEALVLNLRHIGDFTEFLLEHFLRKWNLTSVPNSSDGGSLCRLIVHWHISKHNTCNAYLALTLNLQQIQQENSNGGLLLLTQGSVYANKAESVTNRQDFFPVMMCTYWENLKLLVMRYGLWFIGIIKNEWVDFYHYRLVDHIL